jgi:uncharacterized protein
MQRRFLLISLLVCVSLPNLFAQASDAPATRADVLKLFDTMKIHQQMRLVMDSVMKQQRAMIHEALKKSDPQITEQELARLDQFTTDSVKDMPVDDLLNDMIPVYQKHLSRSDVDAMNVFYSSPTGQKLLQEMPAMTAESMQAASPHMQAMMEKVMNRAEQALREEHGKRTAPPKSDSVKN